MVPVVVGTAVAWHGGAAVDWTVAAVALAAAVLIQVDPDWRRDPPRGDFPHSPKGW